MSKYAPLPQSVMLTGLIGFIISALFTYSGRFNISWGLSFMIVFLVMLISSIVSITPGYEDFR